MGLCVDAPDPPQADPRTFEILDKQVAMSKEALQFAKDSFALNDLRQQKLDGLQLDIGSNLLRDMKTNRERGDAAYDFYLQNGRPVQEKVLKEAMNYDSEENIAAARGRASADVAQAFGNVEQQQARTLSRFGVMPNANRLAAINSNLAIAKAAQQAGGMNNAEQGIRDRAVSMRTGAANMAAGFPNTAMQWGQAGQGAGQAAFGNNMAANSANMANNQFMMGGYGSAQQGMNGAANTVANLNSSQMQGWSAGQSAGASNMSGMGSLVGMGMSMFNMADGGKIEGPGTGVSDSIPAVNTDNGQPIRVSNGEFVVPADVVRAKGEEFFNKLIEKHHTPAAIQRRTRRVQ